MQKILFLSALDFKEKSIQVIRKTPEAYINSGWDVTYIVARDNTPDGNYFYESVIDIPGAKITRFFWPFPKLRSVLPRLLSLLLTKIASLIVIVKLFFMAYKHNKNESFDVIYGYELQGVLAMQILRPFLKKNQKTISRFQGTFLNEMIEKKQFMRVLFNFDLVMAIRLKSDLLIMTDDGTQGDLAVQRIKSGKKYNMLFLSNGVDVSIDSTVKKTERSDMNDGIVQFITVSRLVGWKRVDRAIRLVYTFLQKNAHLKTKLIIVGDGSERTRLEGLVKELGIQQNVNFVGSVKQEEVAQYLANSDIFISMYQSSNVGNPLLEAIRAGKLIVTLNNGDTRKWVFHKETGLIYDEATLNFDEVANDIYYLLENLPVLENIKKNLKDFENAKLYTWDDRFKIEMAKIKELLA